MTRTFTRGARLAKWLTVIMLSQATAAGALWLALAVLFPQHVWLPTGWASVADGLASWGSPSAMWLKTAIVTAAAVVGLLPALIGAMLVYDRPASQR